MVTELFLMIFGYVFFEKIGGYFLVNYWRLHGWKNDQEALWKTRFKGFLKKELAGHALYHQCHRQYLQPDGTFQRQATFDPRLGWRFPANSRVYLDHLQGIQIDNPKEAGLFTDKNGIIPNQKGLAVDLSQKPFGSKRIFLIGGSAPAGLGSFRSDTEVCIQNHETIAALCERDLRVRLKDPNFEMLNACVHGYSSVNELVYYSIELSHYPHDMVVAFHGYNDAIRAILLDYPEKENDPIFNFSNRLNLDASLVQNIHQMRRIERLSLSKRLYQDALVVIKGLTLSILIRWTFNEARRSIFLIIANRPRFPKWLLAPYKRLRRFYRENIQSDSKSFLEYTGDSKEFSLNEKKRNEMRIREFVERQIKNDLKLAALAKLEQRKSMIVLQPFLLTKKDMTDFEKSHLPKKIEQRELYQLYLKLEKQLYLESEEKFKNLGCQIVDLIGLIDDYSEQMYGDLIHYNDRAIRIISDQLVLEVEKSLV